MDNEIVENLALFSSYDWFGPRMSNEDLGMTPPTDQSYMPPLGIIHDFLISNCLVGPDPPAFLLKYYTEFIKLFNNFPNEQISTKLNILKKIGVMSKDEKGLK